MLWWSEYELLWSASTPTETRELLICKQTTHVSFWPSSTFCRAGLRSSRSSATCSRGASGAKVASVAAYPACRTYLSVVLCIVARCRSKRNQAVQARRPLQHRHDVVHGFLVPVLHTQHLRSPTYLRKLTYTSLTITHKLLHTILPYLMSLS